MKAKKYLMAFAAIAALSSCSQNEELDLDNGQPSYGKNAVTFGTYLCQKPQTRATVTDIDVMKGATYPGFGVFAYNTGASNFADASTAVPDFMCNVPVKWNGTDEAWTYDEEKQWPESEKVSFFAYAPYTGAAGTTLITALPDNTSTGAPVISFKVAEQVSDQIDLLYAEAKTDQMKETNSGKVQFSFKHALSRVGFKAKLKGKASDNLKSITINNITLKSSQLSVSADLNLLSGAWSNHANGEMEYAFSAGDFIAGSNIFNSADAGKGESVQLTDAEKYLMLIPTEPSDKALVEITINYVEETTDGIKTDYSVPVTFGQAFEQGKAYNFVLAISLESSGEISSNVKFDVVNVVDWNDPADSAGDDVSVDYEAGKAATIILNGSTGISNGYEVYLAGVFMNGNSRRVIRFGSDGSFTMPNFSNETDKSDPNYFTITFLEGSDLQYTDPELLGWSKIPVAAWTDEDLGFDTREEFTNSLKEKGIFVGAGDIIQVKSGETINIYPVYYFSAF